MINEVGTIYFILIVMLYICFAIDLFSYIMVFAAKKTNINEFCTYGVKLGKLIMYFIFGIIMLAVGFVSAVSQVTKIVHFIIGALLIIDFIFGLVIKIKFGMKKNK